MAFRHYALTLTGAPQRLSSVLADPTVGGAQDVPLRQVFFQADVANAAALYIGGDALVTAISHAFSLQPLLIAAQAALQPSYVVSVGPYEMGPLKLSDFWVLGTNGQRLMIGVVPF
jgi:hypothetical protein